PADPALLHSASGRGEPSPSLHLATGEDLPTAIQQLWERGQCSRGVVDAIGWARDARPTLDLRGEQFALLGAGAELAPTQLLLASGAEVLWVDVRDPVENLSRSAGTLRYSPGG